MPAAVTIGRVVLRICRADDHTPVHTEDSTTVCTQGKESCHMGFMWARGNVVTVPGNLIEEPQTQLEDLFGTLLTGFNNLMSERTYLAICLRSSQMSNIRPDVRSNIRCQIRASLRQDDRSNITRQISDQMSDQTSNQTLDQVVINIRPCETWCYMDPNATHNTTLEM